jgi:hypothetical protein
MKSLIPVVSAAFLLVGSDVSAQKTVLAPYVCVGNCQVQGGCTKAYYWDNNLVFQNEAGQASPGAFTAPGQVTAFAWGLQGDVYPDKIVWHYPGRPEYARWIKSNSCPMPW